MGTAGDSGLHFYFGSSKGASYLYGYAILVLISLFPCPGVYMSLESLPIAVIDFETTGVDPRCCHPVEIAIVHMNWGADNAEVVYTKRFRPPVPIPLGASKIHHIYDSDVADCNAFEDHLEEIQALLSGRVVSAYNLGYDLSILGIYSSLHSDFRGICGLMLSRFLDPYRRGKGAHRLVNVCARNGIVLENAHEAASDALASAKLLDLQLKMLQNMGKRFDDFDSFWDWHRSFAVADEENFIRYMKRKGFFDESRFFPWTKGT